MTIQDKRYTLNVLNMLLYNLKISLHNVNTCLYSSNMSIHIYIYIHMFIYVSISIAQHNSVQHMNATI